VTPDPSGEHEVEAERREAQKSKQATSSKKQTWGNLKTYPHIAWLRAGSRRAVQGTTPDTSLESCRNEDRLLSAYDICLVFFAFSMRER
jgi:hypothetical protein